MNIVKETNEQPARVPKGKEKQEIKDALKAEFGEMVTYDKAENCIYVCDNQYLMNPVLIKILGEFRCYFQASLF